MICFCTKLSRHVWLQHSTNFAWLDCDLHSVCDIFGWSPRNQALLPPPATKIDVGITITQFSRTRLQSNNPLYQLLGKAESNTFTCNLQTASAPRQIIQSCNQPNMTSVLPKNNLFIVQNLNRNSTWGPIHITHYQATYAQKTINSVILELHGLPVFFSTIFLSTMDMYETKKIRSS